MAWLLAALPVAACQSIDTEQGDGRWFAQPFTYASKRVSSARMNEARTATAARAGAGIKPKSFDDEGSGDMIGQGPPKDLPPELLGGDPVTLNLANASIEAAAKSVLGDTLKLNYSVDPAVSGKITIETSAPVSKQELIRLFENALEANGAAIMRSGTTYRVVTAEQARTSPGTIDVGSAPSKGAQIGATMRIVPLHYVAASDMQRILEPMVGKSSIVAADDNRNTLTLTGNSQEIDSILGMIAIFDVDMMRAKSVVSVSVQASPEAIAADLRSVFGSGGMKGMVQFLPNERLKSILAISSQRAYLAKAETWIKRLDVRAQGTRKQLFTYRVQNRPVKELAEILNDMLSGGSRSPAPARTVAPRYEASETQSEDAPAAQADPSSRAPMAGNVVPTVGAGEEVGEDADGMRISADDTNNSLLVLASADDYQRIRAMIETLDKAPKQVLIEATIAEVALNDDLKFGVRWYFSNRKSGYRFTDAAAGVFGSVFPGFSYAWQAANIQATLSALSEVTQVNIVSAPSLTVVDNRTATLQIGDQVPIITQSASDVEAPGSPIVNSVNYRDTGVILSITPRINENGRVLLKVEQEVSSVAETTSSKIDSPTIKQRKVKTTVMVNDNEALALGGIIQTQTSRSRAQVPILGELPVLGNAFRHSKDSASKTELIVLITPHVVLDPHDASAITAEYRQRLRVEMASPRSLERSLGRTVRQIAE